MSAIPRVSTQPGAGMLASGCDVQVRQISLVTRPRFEPAFVGCSDIAMIFDLGAAAERIDPTRPLTIPLTIQGGFGRIEADAGDQKG